MAGESNGKLPDSGAGYMAMLRNLGREEILEILSEGLCQQCDAALQKRIQTLTERKLSDMSISNEKVSESSTKLLSADSSDLVLPKRNINSSNTTWGFKQTPESVLSGRGRPSSMNKRSSFKPSDYEILLNDGLSKGPSVADGGMSEEQKEYIRFEQVGRRKDFSYYERINGKSTNVLRGLELHARVFNTEEQKEIVECVYNLQRLGQKGQLRARTYSEPRKWMRGKGRVTLQFGCCYNYAVDKNGNPPGIIRDEEVDPLPPLFKKMIKRMVRWHVLPTSCIPNSCIVNIYDEGDCIPPHIDHHDFVRPFCTVSFLTECNILFGSNLKVLSPGEFDGPVSIPLPVGSVLILNGNGADVAKHCVPAVPSKRISITFRRMDEKKLPHHYSPDPELMGIKPLNYSEATKFLAPIEQNENKKVRHERSQLVEKAISEALVIQKDDFPPLGRVNSRSQERINRVNSRNHQTINRNEFRSGY